MTNSSSSSFVCKISGRCDGGMDAYYADYGFCQCKNEHMIDEDITREVTDEEKIKYLINESKSGNGLLNEIIEDKYGQYDFEQIEVVVNVKNGEKLQEEEKDIFWNAVEEAVGYEYNILGCECPYCMMDYFEQDDLAKYIKKELGISYDEVIEFVNERNKSREDVFPIDYIEYATRKCQIGIWEIEDEIRRKFETYDDFWSYIKDVRL